MFHGVSWQISYNLSRSCSYRYSLIWHVVPVPILYINWNLVLRNCSNSPMIHLSSMSVLGKVYHCIVLMVEIRSQYSYIYFENLSIAFVGNFNIESKDPQCYCITAFWEAVIRVCHQNRVIGDLYRLYFFFHWDAYTITAKAREKITY